MPEPGNIFDKRFWFSHGNEHFKKLFPWCILVQKRS